MSAMGVGSGVAPYGAALWDAAPVIPVVDIASVDDAVPVAQSLAAGGIRVIEVTLRTPAALPAIAEIAAECPDVTVGAGTVRSVVDVERALEAGARFLVTPGTPGVLAATLMGSGVPCLPGVSTVTEAMSLADRGFGTVKFFPAAALGGPAWIRAVAGPLPDLRVVPSGGVSLSNASDYLGLPTVPCVAASWLTPRALVEGGDWEGITGLARQALEVLRPHWSRARSERL